MKLNKVAHEIPGSQLMMHFNPVSIAPDLFTETQLHIIHSLLSMPGLASCIAEASSGGFLMEPPLYSPVPPFPTPCPGHYYL